MTLDAFIRHRFSSVVGMYLFLRFGATSSSSPPRLLTLWGIMQDVTAGLKFIHSLNAIHRDIKPKNCS